MSEQVITAVVGEITETFNNEVGTGLLGWHEWNLPGGSPSEVLVSDTGGQVLIPGVAYMAATDKVYISRGVAMVFGLKVGDKFTIRPLAGGI